MFFWKNRNKKHFTVRFPEESREVCTNPGRGWYHIYTFTLDKREKDGLLYQPYWDDETLVLVRFDIGAFRGMSLSEEALEYANEILKCFHSRGKEIILRVLYDTQGKGMEREPTLFSIVLTHMRQLGAVVRAYESDILITQGLFIGNWGEMHGSKFLDQEYIRKLYAAWRKAIGPDIRIALRKPSFCRMAVTNENDKAVPGVFDDAILGSENHMGTFGVKRRADSAWTEDWCIADEIGYMQETCGQIPFGGEVLSGQNPAAKEMLRALCDLRVSYLNSIHEEQVLNRWKQMEYGEWGSFYQYISVIVPVYNVKNYLEDCVQSITHQTYPDLEILLIDDGSDDGSGEICDRLQMTDARIRVFHEKHKGVSGARNKGLKEAAGAYIAFVDSDDVLEPDMYTYLIRLLKTHEAQIAACSGWYKYDAGVGKKFESPADVVCMNGREALGVLHERSYLRAYVWNKLFQREVLDGIRFSTELSFAEDYEMFCRVLEQCDTIVCGTKAEYYYMQRKSGICNRGYDGIYQKAMMMFEDYCNVYSRRYPQYKKLFENHYLFDLMGMAAAMSRNGNYVAADCRKIKKYVRQKLPQYLTDKKVSLYLKGSACVVSVSVRAFGAVYRMLHCAEFE